MKHSCLGGSQHTEQKLTNLNKISICKHKSESPGKDNSDIDIGKEADHSDNITAHDAL